MSRTPRDHPEGGELGDAEDIASLDCIEPEDGTRGVAVGPRSTTETIRAGAVAELH